MPVTGESDLVGFDADAALTAAREVAGDGVRSFVEFTATDFKTLFVDDGILEMYRDEAHMREHYGQVLDHLNMDFLERDAYEQTLLPNAGRVRAIVTRMEELTLLRVIYGDEGLYIALDPAVSTLDVTDAVEDVMVGGR
jgi:hypothetical protein